MGVEPTTNDGLVTLPLSYPMSHKVGLCRTSQRHSPMIVFFELYTTVCWLKNNAFGQLTAELALMIKRSRTVSISTHFDNQRQEGGIRTHINVFTVVLPVTLPHATLLLRRGLKALTPFLRSPLPFSVTPPIKPISSPAAESLIRLLASEPGGN